MFVGGRLLLFLLIIWSISLLLNAKGEVVNTNERRKRHIFPLHSYLKGYKIGQNLAVQLPPFVLSPVIIVPSVNQQQSVNIQNGATEESFQENGDTIQTIIPLKLILNSSLEDVETNFRSPPGNNTVQEEKVIGLNDTLRQVNEATDSSAENVEIGELVSTTENFATTIFEELTTLKPNTPTTVFGVYPTAVYNNKMINSLQLTTPSGEIVSGLPSTEDKWKNFSSNASKNDNENRTENIGKELQESASGRVDLYRITTERYYPRPNTRYYNPWYNAKVDQFSITTNSYRDEGKELPLLLRYDDRWNRFSSLSKVVSPTSEFKPLAGLYYDGFLHKYLTKKTGFIPFDKYYY